MLHCRVYLILLGIVAQLALGQSIVKAKDGTFMGSVTSDGHLAFLGIQCVLQDFFRNMPCIVTTIANDMGHLFFSMMCTWA
jgi:hypothetical protein